MNLHTNRKRSDLWAVFLRLSKRSRCRFVWKSSERWFWSLERSSVSGRCQDACSETQLLTDLLVHEQRQSKPWRLCLFIKKCLMTGCSPNTVELRAKDLFDFYCLNNKASVWGHIQSADSNIRFRLSWRLSFWINYNIWSVFVFISPCLYVITI